MGANKRSFWCWVYFLANFGLQAQTESCPLCVCGFKDIEMYYQFIRYGGAHFALASPDDAAPFGLLSQFFPIETVRKNGFKQAELVWETELAQNKTSKPKISVGNKQLSVYFDTLGRIQKLKYPAGSHNRSVGDYELFYENNSPKIRQMVKIAQPIQDTRFYQRADTIVCTYDPAQRLSRIEKRSRLRVKNRADEYLGYSEIFGYDAKGKLTQKDRIETVTTKLQKITQFITRLQYQNDTAFARLSVKDFDTEQDWEEEDITIFFYNPNDSCYYQQTTPKDKTEAQIIRYRLNPAQQVRFLEYNDSEQKSTHFYTYLANGLLEKISFVCKKGQTPKILRIKYQ